MWCQNLSWQNLLLLQGKETSYPLYSSHKTIQTRVSGFLVAKSNRTLQVLETFKANKRIKLMNTKGHCHHFWHDFGNFKNIYRSLQVEKWFYFLQQNSTNDWHPLGSENGLRWRGWKRIVTWIYQDVSPSKVQVRLENPA